MVFFVKTVVVSVETIAKYEVSIHTKVRDVRGLGRILFLQELTIDKNIYIFTLCVPGTLALYIIVTVITIPMAFVG